MTQRVGEAALEVAGEESFDETGWPDSQTVSVDGQKRFVRPVGDFGVGSIQVLFTVDGCPYVNFLPDGTGEAASLDYASRF